ncbi:hypothetical protein ACIQM0_04190 [Streptomyces sp. NPDC091387]|uniref:hypothetical protein n=1 Tax=Streptomyces sp. NPDC091387 TaxID=3365998 RepID=UPI003814D280
MSTTKWAAMAIAVIALGVTGCGTSDTGTGAAAASAPAAPRPKGTGPLPEKVVRADLDSSAANAGVPNNAPDFARSAEERTDDSLMSCAVAFKGFGTKTTPVDLTRFEKLVSELRERDWRPPRKDLKGADAVGETRVVLKQRGWSMVASHMDIQKGVVTLLATEDACVKRTGIDAGVLG